MMRSLFLILTAAVIAAIPAVAASPQAKRTAAAPASSPRGVAPAKSASAPNKPGVQKSAVTPAYRTWNGGARYRRAPVRRWVARRPAYAYPLQPTQDRYREIQQALASKGHFAGEANGVWGADSTDALRRFQSEQNLDGDGRLNSLSLIALGLGPKREPLPPGAPLLRTEPSSPAAAGGEAKADSPRQ